MAEITASMVKELREKTDAPMMECKKALSEAAGDMAKAEEILRVKLGNKASKAASRVTAEGVVGVYISADAKLGAMVEVNCETDFVAKNDDFLALTKNIAELVAKPADADRHVVRFGTHRIGGRQLLLDRLLDFLGHQFHPIDEKKTAKKASRTMTRKMAATTAEVVRLPTCSAFWRTCIPS